MVNDKTMKHVMEATAFHAKNPHISTKKVCEMFDTNCASLKYCREKFNIPLVKRIRSNKEEIKEMKKLLESNNGSSSQHLKASPKKKKIPKPKSKNSTKYKKTATPKKKSSAKKSPKSSPDKSSSQLSKKDEILLKIYNDAVGN